MWIIFPTIINLFKFKTYNFYIRILQIWNIHAHRSNWKVGCRNGVGQNVSIAWSHVAHACHSRGLLLCSSIVIHVYGNRGNVPRWRANRFYLPPLSKNNQSNSLISQQVSCSGQRVRQHTLRWNSGLPGPILFLCGAIHNSWTSDTGDHSWIIVIFCAKCITFPRTVYPCIFPISNIVIFISEIKIYSQRSVLQT